ncbi:alpha/beta-hydrolase [Gloeophyllum trabeum ATCC 11539]|uniref:Alpha/beta-hydrolase n=1 Tax=Gloeophyllum trabeum (strain ATCC 11539 / FP-39264 / Madison 617) TaxID=670483 RepID=S7RVU5_GLOTA|nr:alpha/beta-hydrolase [Gloeophyllum trabeum ATCC 11539]EPQ57404.1 alpha/beta-hydrolase [Gloeophyllum trabeum ATCC 11539]
MDYLDIDVQKKAKGNWATKVQGVKEVDISISGTDGHKIPIRLHSPATPPADGSPLVMIFHGGGFVAGGLHNETESSRLFVQNLGCVVVNVDYRLAPKHPFPAAPNDCWDATKWVAANAAELKADPSKGFIIAGTSSGGNLAAVCGVLARDHQLSPPVTGLLLMVPCFFDSHDIPEKYKGDLKSYEEQKNAATLNQSLIDTFEAAYKPDGNSTLYNLYTPNATRAGLPPTFLQVCELDPLRDDAIVFERELREDLGIPTKLLKYDNVPHGFWAFWPHKEESKRFMMDTVDGLRWLLSHPSK